VPRAGFLDNRTRGTQISLAAGWGVRRAPSLLDVGQRRLLGWDGRRDAVYNQIFGVIESDREMNSSRLFVAQQVFAQLRAEYETIFGPLPALDDGARFPRLTAALAGCDPPAPLQAPVCRGRPGDGASYDHLTPEAQEAVTRVVVNVGKALGAYLRQLRCGPGRLDAWLGGDAQALTPAEQRGAKLFLGRGHCADCHSGPHFTDFKFHNVGLRPAVVAVAFIDRDDRGAAKGLADLLQDPLNTRGKFSDADDHRLPAAVGPELEGAFETPMLRCASQRPSFMHTGQLATLDEVLGFFNVGGDHDGFPGASELQPLGLSAEERADLLAFLHTLDGPGPPASLLAPP
jgi:cytochrome c peroxidase